MNVSDGEYYVDIIEGVDILVNHMVREGLVYKMTSQQV